MIFGLNKLKFFFCCMLFFSLFVSHLRKLIRRYNQYTLSTNEIPMRKGIVLIERRITN